VSLLSEARGPSAAEAGSSVFARTDCPWNELLIAVVVVVGIILSPDRPVVVRRASAGSRRE
jgi:hypothetical protein